MGKGASAEAPAPFLNTVRRVLPTASAASVTAAAMATATATAAATLLRLVDTNIASVDFGFVQGVDGCVCALIFHFDETETARAARVTIQDYFGRVDIAVLSKKIFELLVVDTPREVSDKKILHTVGWALGALSFALKVQPPSSPWTLAKKMPAGFVSGRHSKAFGTVFRVEYAMIRCSVEKIRLFQLIVQSSHEDEPTSAV